MNENKERLLAYLNEDMLTDEQMEFIVDLVNGVSIWDLIRAGKLGYKKGHYDTARPLEYMNKLKEMGINDEIIEGCLFDYTEKSFGELSSYKTRFFNYILKLFSY